MTKSGPNQPLQLTAGIYGFMTVFWFAMGFGLSDGFRKNPAATELWSSSARNKVMNKNQVTTIVLIRHAESSPSRDIPESNWPLSSRGIVQAQELGEALSDIGITAVISSPYRRALDTVRPLG